MRERMRRRRAVNDDNLGAWRRLLGLRRRYRRQQTQNQHPGDVTEFAHVKILLVGIGKARWKIALPDRLCRRANEQSSLFRGGGLIGVESSARHTALDLRVLHEGIPDERS